MLPVLLLVLLVLLVLPLLPVVDGDVVPELPVVPVVPVLPVVPVVVVSQLGGIVTSQAATEPLIAKVSPPPEPNSLSSTLNNKVSVGSKANGSMKVKIAQSSAPFPELNS